MPNRPNTAAIDWKKYFNEIKHYDTSTYYSSGGISFYTKDKAKDMATVTISKRPLDDIIKGRGLQYARDYNLSSVDGIMRQWLLTGRKIQHCYVGLGHGNYIGCCTALTELDPEFNCDIGIFIDSRYRFRGYAEQLLLKVIEDSPRKKHTCWVGDTQSAEFFTRFLEKHPDTLLTTDKYTPRN